MLSSFSTAFPYMFMFSVHALVIFLLFNLSLERYHELGLQAFGYGGSLVRSGEIDGGKVVRVLLAVIMASTGFGQVSFVPRPFVFCA